MEVLLIPIHQPLQINLGSEPKVIDRLELCGNGTLSVCTLSFYNGDELSTDEYVTAIFSKTDHPTEYILTSHKKINLAEFSYCSLKVFAGNIGNCDELRLYYS